VAALKGFYELFQCESGRPNDGAQSATVELAVVGHDNLGVYMATLLSLSGESGLGESSDTGGAREARQFHTAPKTASKFSSGTGRPSACRVAT